MALLWILFVIVFLKTISLYQNIKSTYNKKKGAEINNSVYGIHTSTIKEPPIENDDDIKNNQKINIFDRMKYIGELLEKIIEDKFTR